MPKYLCWKTISARGSASPVGERRISTTFIPNSSERFSGNKNRPILKAESTDRGQLRVALFYYSNHFFMNSNFSQDQSNDGHFPYGNQASYRDFMMPVELETSFREVAGT